MIISLITAMGNNNVIGFNNRMPWKLPADLAYFKRVTMSTTIIMGRKTYEAIGRPLPGRKNVVLTRDKSFQADNCTIFHSMEELMSALNECKEEVFIIGGGEIFRLFLPMADRLYITLIDKAFDGDTFFPHFDADEWEVVTKAEGKKDDDNVYDHTFIVLKRKKQIN